MMILAQIALSQTVIDYFVIVSVLLAIIGTLFLAYDLLGLYLVVLQKLWEGCHGHEGVVLQKLWEGCHGHEGEPSCSA